jgi:hypothetical protein
LLLPDLHAVGWTAMWRGVIAPDARTAQREACSQVLFVPLCLAFGLWSIVVSLHQAEHGGLVFVVAWLVFSAWVDWWSGRRASRKLHAELELWALRRSAGELEHYDGWRRAGRWLGRRWRVWRGRA